MEAKPYANSMNEERFTVGFKRSSSRGLELRRTLGVQMM